jgi:hypothetical protein
VFTGEDPRVHWHLALNLEGGYQPARFDPARWGFEVRPIIEWVVGALHVDL